MDHKCGIDGIKNIIAVAAGKGGVGKSTVSVNLAMVLRDLGYSVGLLDADVYGPSICKMLGTTKVPSEENNQIKPAYAQGILHISLAFFEHILKSTVVRAPIANNIIEQFIHHTMWGALDFLIVDFPPGTGDIQLTLMQQMPFSFGIAVTTPQRVSMIDVEKAINMFIRMNVEVMGIIENMSYYEADKKKYMPFGEGAGDALSKQYGIDLLAQIPIDDKISYCCDKGESLFDTNSETKEMFYNIADKIKNFITQKKHKKHIEVEWHLNGKAFVITYSDGTSIVGKTKELQRRCPCIRCDEIKPPILDEVSILDVDEVGNYGLRFYFSSGCSKGIYTLDSLKKL
ncbi:MAG: P-loop NTPase [Chlamydiales bacterium]|nr:P-loop NTPase [Chlamydiales bacterium]